MKSLKILTILLATALVTACGYKSSLYLPEKGTIPTESIQNVENVEALPAKAQN